MNPKYLELKALHVESISGQVLVDGVSLSLNRGEVLGLIGESGAGKSTIGLASMVYARGGCHIRAGEVWVDGRSIRTLDADQRRGVRGVRIAYIAQSAAASFNPAHRLMDQVCEMPLQHKLMSRVEARAWAIELFKALDLPDPEHFGERYPHQVSGGQLQRAMAAMAMSCRPDVLVLDEPTTALDVTTQIEVLALLKKLIRDHNMAALYITHDLAVVAQVADRILVLRHGKEVELGTTEQILMHPQQAYTAALVAERSASEQASEATTARHGNDDVLTVDTAVGAYGDAVIVRGVSLRLQRGQTVAVVGESGSGKSSLARLVAGLLPRRSGDIRLLGQSLEAAYGQRTKEQLRRMQLIFQLPDVALNPRHTVGETIGRPLKFYFGLPDEQVRQRVSALLTQVGLPAAFSTRLTSALSGGQKQRVCIARALAAEPDVIICDEPTSALDPLVADEILKLLKKLQDDMGLAFLFITHDLGVVRRIAHRTAVMFKGEFVAQGPTSRVFSPPFHPYTERLISSVPEMRTDWLDEVLAQRATH